MRVRCLLLAVTLAALVAFPIARMGTFGLIRGDGGTWVATARWPHVIIQAMRWSGRIAVTVSASFPAGGG